MMYYGDGHMSGWGWFGMTIGMIAFWGLLILLAVLVYRAFSGDNSVGSVGGRDGGSMTRDPIQILAERYARGEIDDQEYQRRLAVLSGTPHRPVAS